MDGSAVIIHNEAKIVILNCVGEKTFDKIRLTHDDQYIYFDVHYSITLSNEYTFRITDFERGRRDERNIEHLNFEPVPDTNENETIFVETNIE